MFHEQSYSKKITEKYPWFAGRWQRRKYILAQLLILLPVPVFIFYVTSSNESSNYREPVGSGLIFVFEMIVPIIICFLSFIPIMVVQFLATIARLKDIDANPIYAFLYFVPVVAFIQMMYLSIKPGTKGSNQYGPNPTAVFEVQPKKIIVEIPDSNIKKLIRSKEWSIDLKTEGSHKVLFSVGYDKTKCKYYLKITSTYQINSEGKKQYFDTLLELRHAISAQTKYKLDEFFNENI